MLPNFLVIGAPRSGTTWIERNLRAHPDVFMPSVKELHFFDRDYERGLEHYERFFAGWAGQAAVGEATPSYLSGGGPDRDVARLIARHLPDVRLIASLRNPVDRLYSRYWNSRAKFESNADLSFEQKVSSKPEFLREGLYADHLQLYLESFPKEQMLVLLYDDLESDKGRFMERIFEFLQIDPQRSPGLEATRVNAAAGKGALGKSSFAWTASRFLIRIGARRLADRVHAANSLPLPEMSQDTRRRLVEYYQPHNERLARLINRDLAAWSRC
jgi:hypothetical protein